MIINLKYKHYEKDFITDGCAVCDNNSKFARTNWLLQQQIYNRTNEVQSAIIDGWYRRKGLCDGRGPNNRCG